MRAVLLISPAKVAGTGAAPDLVLVDRVGAGGAEPGSVFDHVRAMWPTTLLFGRIRPLASGGLEDVAALMPTGPDGIWLADAIGRAEIEQLGSRLAVAEAELGLPDGRTRIVASIESARGALASVSFPGSSPRLVAISHDPVPLARDLGCEPSAAGRLPEPLRTVRAGVVLTAAAAGLPAIDASTFALPDLDAYALEASEARRDGFSAKLVQNTGEFAVLRSAAAQAPLGRWIENFVSGVATK